MTKCGTSWEAGRKTSGHCKLTTAKPLSKSNAWPEWSTKTPPTWPPSSNALVSILKRLNVWITPFASRLNKPNAGKSAVPNSRPWFRPSPPNGNTSTMNSSRRSISNAPNTKSSSNLTPDSWLNTKSPAPPSKNTKSWSKNSTVNSPAYSKSSGASGSSVRSMIGTKRQSHNIKLNFRWRWEP